MYAYTMEHICSYGVTLHSPFEVIGETPLGLRVNAYVSGGTVEGPRIRGEFLPVGGHWLTGRRHGGGNAGIGRRSGERRGVCRCAG